MAEELQLSRLTLSELHERLNQRGVKISTGKLSEFINLGDIEQQLEAQTVGNRKEFHPDVIEVLVEFLPKFRGLKGVSWEQAPNYLRSFLKKENSALVASPSQIQESTNRQTELLSEILETMKAQRVLPPPEDRLIDRQEAAQILSCHPRAVGRYVRAVRPGKWRRSDVLAYIASL